MERSEERNDGERKWGGVHLRLARVRSVSRLHSRLHSRKRRRNRAATTVQFHTRASTSFCFSSASLVHARLHQRRRRMHSRRRPSFVRRVLLERREILRAFRILERSTMSNPDGGPYCASDKSLGPDAGKSACNEAAAAENFRRLLRIRGLRINGF